MAENPGVVACIWPCQGLKRRRIIAVPRGVERPERVPGGRIESQARAGAAVGDELPAGSGSIEKTLIRRSRLLQRAPAEVAARSVNALAVAIAGISDDVR